MLWSDHFFVLETADLEEYESLTVERRYFQDARFESRPLGLRPSPAPAAWVSIGLSPFLFSGETSGRRQVGQVLSAIRLSLAEGRDLGFRVYLDPLWEEFAAELVALGCEVALMEHSGAAGLAQLWPLLALEDLDGVTVMSVRGLRNLEKFTQWTQVAGRSGLAGWRSPCREAGEYWAVGGEAFGCTGRHPMRRLLGAYLWFAGDDPERGEGEALAGIEGEPVAPDLLRDHLGRAFLMAALYPRLAKEGLLTLLPEAASYDADSLMDVEFCSKSSPKSELAFVGMRREPGLNEDWQDAALSCLFQWVVVAGAER